MQLPPRQIQEQGIEAFFSDLSLTYDIPIALEIASNNDGLATYMIDFKGGTLSEFLTRFVAEHKEYTWEIKDGVVSVFPKEKYRDLPEVKSLLERNHVTVPRLSDYAYFPSIYSKPDVDLSISHSDVRGVLKKIARESEHNIWFVQWRDEKRRELMLGF